MLSNKSFNFNDLNIKVDLIVKFLLFVIGVFVFFDINIFLFSFKYSLGSFIEILSTLELFSVSFILLVLVVPFSLIGMYFVSHVFIEKLFNYLLIQNKFVNIISKANLMIIIILVYFLFFAFYFATNDLWKFVDSFDNVFVNFLFLFLLSVIVIGSVKFIIFVKKEQYKKRKVFYYNNLDWIIFWKFIIFYVIVFISELSVVVKLVNLILVFFIASIFSQKTIRKNKSQGSLVLPILVSFFLVILTFQIINQNSWKTLINNTNQSINSFTFNLIFNKSFLMENKSSVKLEIPYKYFKNEINKLSKEKLVNLKVKLKEKEVLFFEIDQRFYYLKASSTINMYFINWIKKGDENILIKNIEDNGKENIEEMGFITLLVEKKNFSNKKGAEYILMDMKIVKF